MPQEFLSEMSEATVPDGVEILNTNIQEKSFLDILKERVMSSIVFTPQEAMEIIKIAESVHPPEFLEAWLKHKIGNEKFVLLFPESKSETVATEQSTNEPLKVESEVSKSTTTESDNHSIWKAVLQTVEKLILSAKDMFPDSSGHRLAYVRYVLTAIVLVAGLGAGYMFLDKHPEAASASKSNVMESKNEVHDIGAGGVNVQASSGSGNVTQTVNVSNGVGKEEISAVDKRLGNLEERIGQVLAFLEKSTSVPSANAAEPDPVAERQARQSVLEVKDEVDILKKASDVTAEQKKRIDTLDMEVIKVLGKLTNRPTWHLNEIADISKTEYGDYLFRTLYIEDGIDFTTQANSKGTSLLISSPIKKSYLITCKNLLPDDYKLGATTIIVGDSCQPDDVKYIQPLFIRKNFELYGLPTDDTKEIEKRFILYHGSTQKSKDNTITCDEQHCVTYSGSTISLPILLGSSTLKKKYVKIDARSGEITYPTK